MPDAIATKDRGEEFAQLVRNSITNSKRHTITSVADGTRMSYHSFHQRLDGKTPFSADEIRRLIACFPDAAIVSYLLQGTPYVAADRLEIEWTEAEHAIYEAVHRIVFEASDVLRVVDVALKDHKIDKSDAKAISIEIDQAERSLASLRNFVATMK